MKLEQMRQREHRQNWLWWLPSCDKWFWGPVGSITCIFKDAYFRNNSSVFLSCSSSDLQGRLTSLRSTLCSLADRYCSQYLLFTIMWKINCIHFVSFFLPCRTTQTCCRLSAEALVFTERTTFFFFFSWHANMLGQRAVWVTVNGISQAVLKLP